MYFFKDFGGNEGNFYFNTGLILTTEQKT